MVASESSIQVKLNNESNSNQIKLSCLEQNSTNALPWTTAVSTVASIPLAATSASAGSVSNFIPMANDVKVNLFPIVSKRKKNERGNRWKLKHSQKTCKFIETLFQFRFKKNNCISEANDKIIE